MGKKNLEKKQKRDNNGGNEEKRNTMDKKNGIGYKEKKDL